MTRPTPLTITTEPVMSERELIALEAALLDARRTRAVEVRTRYGRWRFVCCVYSVGVLSDEVDVGTIRAEGNSQLGRYPILTLDQIADWRLA
jgi:hypothetical protein